MILAENVFSYKALLVVVVPMAVMLYMMTVVRYLNTTGLRT
jgi:hypothetical protein